MTHGAMRCSPDPVARLGGRSSCSAPGGSAAGLERYQPAACSPPGRPRAPQNGTRRVGHSPSSPARRSSVRRIPRSTASIRNDRRDRGAARLQRLDRGALAGPLRRAWLRRAARRAAPGQAALDRRRGRRAGDRQNARRAAVERDALVDALDGPRDGNEPDRGQPHLARVRAQAPPDRGVRALARPAVHRQGPRHRRALSEPSGCRRRAVRRRKSQIQALDRSAPVLALLPGVPERHTHDYVRNATTNLYAARSTSPAARSSPT
jgi:hypothetical protein